MKNNKFTGKNVVNNMQKKYFYKIIDDVCM